MCRNHSMPQVTNVSIYSELANHLLGSFSDLGRLGVKQMRIQITLKCLAWASSSGLGGRACPAHANTVEVAIFKNRQLAILWEDGQESFWPPLLDLCSNVLEIWHTELLIDPWRKLAAVGVENSEERSTRIKLTNKIFDNDVTQSSQKLPRGIWIQVQPLLRTVKTSHSTTFDHVAHKRPGSSRKTNDGYLIVHLLPCPEDGIEYIAQRSINVRRQDELLHVLWSV
mmetsp:Transcript_28406/g.51300  ORF Transcript_28406/g.51300 Transcript_28406/m.51300 type:complete len:226 (-) Transcript_28406:788-1465(-)